MNNAKQTGILILILILAGILLVLPTIVRNMEGNPYSTNSDSYYNIRIFNEVDGNYFDNLQQRHIPINIIYNLQSKESLNFLINKILMLVVGLATVIMVYAILRKHNMSEKNIWAILLLLIASPIFIYTFMGFNSYGIIIFISLLIIYLMIIDYIWLAAILFCILPFIDIYGAVISFVFIFLHSISNNRSLKRVRLFIILSIAAIIVSIILNTLSGYNILGSIPFEESNIITDIGADIGFSFSSIILSVIGLLLLWEKGWKNLLIYSSILLGIVVAVFNNFVRIYINFILIMYSGFAFVYLTRRKWSIQLIKKITVLLIICSILFTTLVYTTKIIKAKPNNDYIDALKFLEKQSFPEEKVLSSEDNGYIIAYYSDRPAFVDGKTRSYEHYKINILENISTSRNLERTENLLKSNNIRYIFIDQDFRQFLEERQGLLFLIDTSGKFKNIYKNNLIEIWMYTPTEETG